MENASATKTFSRKKFEEVLDGKYGSVLDIDGMAMVSYSKGREGSDYGHSKKFKGRRLLQMSGSFIGKILIAGCFQGISVLPYTSKKL